jgi:hypothetical protein
LMMDHVLCITVGNKNKKIKIGKWVEKEVRRDLWRIERNNPAHPPTGEGKKTREKKRGYMRDAYNPQHRKFSLFLSCIIPPICNIQHVSDPVMSCALYMYALYTPLVGIQWSFGYVFCFPLLLFFFFFLNM